MNPEAIQSVLAKRKVELTFPVKQLSKSMPSTRWFCKHDFVIQAAGGDVRGPRTHKIMITEPSHLQVKVNRRAENAENRRGTGVCRLHPPSLCTLHWGAVIVDLSAAVGGYEDETRS